MTGKSNGVMKGEDLAGGQVDGYRSTGQSPGENLVDVKEMARILNVAVSWLYERTRLNQIPHLKLGKYIRFNPREVLAFYRQNRSTQETA